MGGEDTVKDRGGRPINPTNATWTVEIGEPRARPDDFGPARNTLKLKFTTEVDPATYADGIVVEKQVAGGWEEEPRGSATIAPREHRGLVSEIGLRPLGGWERGATYRVRVTEAIRDVRGQPLTNAEDFSFTVPKSGPLDTRHEPRRPVAQANAKAASAEPAFPGGQAMGWHGHWADPVTGLIYMRNRWYDPRSGTFLSPDPLEDIDSPNLYLFGAGRPHEVVDPLGLAVTVKAEVPGAPCNVVPSVDMETGRYPFLDAALLGPLSSLENAGRKALNTIFNAGCAVGAGVDRADQKLWEKGVLCRGCLTFGADLSSTLMGTAELSFAKDVASVYSRGLISRPPPRALVPVRGADVSSVWSRGPGPRGILIEDAIESSGLRSGRLPKGFRGVDFHEGMATSVKSIDLSAASYQKPERVLSTVKGYIDSLQEFTGGSLQGRVIRPSDITGRQLDLIVPPTSPTPAQRLALEEAKRYAAEKNILLNIFSVD